MEVIMKRIIRVLLVALSLAILSVYAGQTEPETKQAAEICAEFGVVDVDSIPAGITPIKISSTGQLKHFLHGIRTNSGPRPTRTSDVLLTEGESCESLIETYVLTHASNCINPLVRTYFNLWGEIWIAGSGSFWQITDAYEWVGLTGPTYYVSLSNTWHHTYISSDRTIATIRGGGILDLYFVFESVF